MHENFKLPLTRQEKKIELGTISGVDQYGYAYYRAKFGACIENRTIQELCRRTNSITKSAFRECSFSKFKNED